MKKESFLKFIKFALVGTLVMLFHIFFVYVLTEIFAWWYLAAVTFSYTCSLILNFLFQKYFVWLNYSTSAIKRQVHLFVWLALSCLGLNTFFMYVLVSVLGLHYMAAQVFVVGLLSLLTFHFNRKYIFSLE